MGEGTRHTTVVETGKVDKTGIPIGMPTSGYVLYNKGAAVRGGG